MKQLQGNAAVITGAASGIGLAIAKEACVRGMRVLAADIDEVALDAAVTSLRERGHDVHGARVDVADEQSVNALADGAFERFGDLYLLVNNAGIAVGEAAWATPLADYRRALDINLYGVIHGVRAFVPHMLASGREGHVVNVASAAGLFTVAGFAAYSASKYAVVGLTEALYHDLSLRKASVHAHVLCPSWVRTPIAQTPLVPPTDPITRDVQAWVTQAVAQGIEPSEVARTVFDAIGEGCFYVLTHESTKAAIQARAEDMVAARPPADFLR